MSKHPDIEKDFFLRSARGNEYDAYAALVAEADAVHHAEMPDLIKAPERAKPDESAFLSCLQDPDRLLDFAVEDTEDGRTIVGLVEARVVKRDENRAHEPNTMARIDLIVVKESHRRRGIGRALLARARNWAEERSTSGIMLDSYAFNIVATRLCEKAGFDVLKKTYIQDFG